MNIPFGDLKRQYSVIKDEIDEAIGKVLWKGWFIPGENVELFEKEFAHYCGAKFCVGVGSGTEALHLSLLACGVKPGDKVITVANTAVATVSAISFANARPIFVDIDLDSYTMNPDKIEQLMKSKIENRKSKIKAILPVHLYGQPANMERVLAIARRYGLKVIEDACQAHGAEYNSKLKIKNEKLKWKKTGTLGDAGCFSFYPSKNLGAYGDGGAIVTDNEEITATVRMLRNYGQKNRYAQPIKGFNSRLDELQAAVLRVKLKYLDQWNKRRREIAKSYNSLLKADHIEKPKEMDYAKHIYHLYVIRTNVRDRLQKYLREKGVETLIHYPVAIHLQEAYRDLGLGKGCLPITEKYANEVLSLPIFPELTDEEIGCIIDTINRF